MHIVIGVLVIVLLIIQISRRFGRAAPAYPATPFDTEKFQVSMTVIEDRVVVRDQWYAYPYALMEQATRQQWSHPPHHADLLSFMAMGEAHEVLGAGYLMATPGARGFVAIIVDGALHPASSSVRSLDQWDAARKAAGRIVRQAISGSGTATCT